MLASAQLITRLIWPATGLLILFFWLSSLTVRAESKPLTCATELDATVALATNPDNDPAALEKRFAALESACPAFAQLAHNQGVLAGMNNRWPQAIVHFERALKKDIRAADTHNHLQQIFRYRAAQAYAKALVTPLQVQPPVLTFQDSSKVNSDSRQSFPEHDQLRDLATVEYELFAWWQARSSRNELSDYYVDGYDIDAIRLARQAHSTKQWQNMKREIAFTESDVVVVLSESRESQTLLLLRLVGSRWKIYQETRL